MKRFSLEQTGDILEFLAETDYRLKTGRTTASTAAEKLILTLARRD
jgi:DNA polymerase III delta subunit